MARRLGVALVLLVLAVGSSFGAMVFGLNGAQWDGWMHAFFAFAGVLVVAAVAAIVVPAAWLARLPKMYAPLGVGGLALVGASVLVMRGRYSDPYDGDLFWPFALAWTAFTGFLLLVAGIFTVFLRFEGRRLSHVEAPS